MQLPLAVEGTLKAAAGTVTLQADTQTQAVTTRGLDLSQLPGWVNRFAELPGTGILDLSVRIKNGEPTLVDAGVTNLRWEDWVAETLAVRGSWGGGGGRIERADIQSTHGRVRIDNMAVDLKRPYRVGALDRVQIDIPDLHSFLAKLPVASLRASLPPGVIVVQVDAQRTDGNRVEVRRCELTHRDSRISLTGSALLPPQPEAWRDTALQLKVSAEVHQPHAYVADLPIIDGVLRLSGDVTGDLETPAVALSLEGRKLVVADRDVAVFSLSGRLAWPRLQVDELNPGGGARDGARRRCARSCESTCRGRFAHARRVRSGRPAGARSREPRRGRCAARNGARHRGRPGRMVRQSRPGRRAVAGRREGHRNGARSCERRRAVDQDRPTRPSTARRGVWPRAARARSTKTSCARGSNASMWRAPASRSGRSRRSTCVSDGNGVWSPALSVAALGGTLSGRAGLRDGTLDLDLVATGMRVERVFSNWAGAAGARLTAKGTLCAPVFQLRIDAPSLGTRDVSGSIRVDVLQDARGVRLRDLNVVAEGVTVTGKGALPWTVGDGGLARVDGVAPSLDLVAVLDRWPDGRLHMLPVRCEALSATIRADAQALAARIRVSGMALTRDPDGPFQLPGTATLDLNVTPDVVTAAWNDGGGAPITLRGSAQLDAGGDWLDPVGLWKAAGDAPLKGELVASLPDLKFLTRLVPGIRRIAGTGRIDIAASGTALQPRVSGTVHLDARDLSLANGPPTLQRLVAEFRVDGDRVAIASCKGMMGYAPFRASGSARVADPIEFDVRLAGENLLVASTPQLRLRTDADLVWKGRVGKATLAGRLNITDALYTSRVDIWAAVVGLATANAEEPEDGTVLFSIRDEPLRGTQFDVRVTASRSAVVRTNLIGGRASADIRLRGSGAVPMPVGTVHVRRPRVGLALGVVQADHALVTFSEHDPFRPTLRIFGGIRPFLSAEMLSDDPEREGLLERIQIEIDTETLTTQDKLRLDQVGLTAELKLRESWYLFAENYRREEYSAGILWRIRFR